MSSQCPCCNQIVPYGAVVNMPNVGTVGHVDYGSVVSKTYTKAELQELKRQNALEVAAAYDSAVRTTEERCNAELQKKQVALLLEILFNSEYCTSKEDVFEVIQDKLNKLEGK